MWGHPRPIGWKPQGVKEFTLGRTMDIEVYCIHRKGEVAGEQSRDCEEAGWGAVVKGQSEEVGDRKGCNFPFIGKCAQCKVTHCQLVL